MNTEDSKTAVFDPEAIERQWVISIPDTGMGPFRGCFEYDYDQLLALYLLTQRALVLATDEPFGPEFYLEEAREEMAKCAERPNFTNEQSNDHKQIGD